MELPDKNEHSVTRAAREPSISWNRMAKIAAIIFLGPFCLLLIALLVWNHGNNLVHRLTTPEPEQIVSQPDTIEDPQPRDDAFIRLAHISDLIDVDEKNLDKHDMLNPYFRHFRIFCRGTPLSQDQTLKTLYRNVCATALQEHGAALQALDSWLSGSSHYKLETPSDSKRHNRHQIAGGSTLSFGKTHALAYLLINRALKQWDEGNVKGAKRDFKTVLALGSFFQQSASMESQADAVWYYQLVLDVIQTDLPSTARPQDVEEMLPVLDKHRDMLMAVVQSGTSQPLRFPGDEIEERDLHGWEKILGLYDRERTRKMYLTHWGNYRQRLLGMSTTNPLGCDSAEKPEVVKDGMLLVENLFLTNGIGAYLACNTLPPDTNFRTVLDEYQWTENAVHATRVVLAARQFHRTVHRWPVREKDLVPKYLKSWPSTIRLATWRFDPPGGAKNGVALPQVGRHWMGDNWNGFRPLGIHQVGLSLAMQYDFFWFVPEVDRLRSFPTPPQKYLPNKPLKMRKKVLTI